jgi:hypothetical protein
LSIKPTGHFSLATALLIRSARLTTYRIVKVLICLFRFPLPSQIAPSLKAIKAESLRNPALKLLCLSQKNLVFQLRFKPACLKGALNQEVGSGSWIPTITKCQLFPGPMILDFLCPKVSRILHFGLRIAFRNIPFLSSALATATETSVTPKIDFKPLTIFVAHNGLWKKRIESDGCFLHFFVEPDTDLCATKATLALYRADA